jgi:hypothetical protein
MFIAVVVICLVVNSATPFPITASFLIVLLIMFTCALFQRRGKKEHSKGTLDEPSVKPVAGVVPGVIPVEVVQSVGAAPDDRIKDLPP